MSENPSPNTPPPPEPVPYTSAMEMNTNARTWGMLCHLSALAGYLIPFGWLLGPLVVWLVKKQEYPFVDDQGKESLNFQITATIAAIISGLLICVAIGIPLLLIVAIGDLVFIIIGSIRASEGKYYRYPWSLRLVK